MRSDCSCLAEATLMAGLETSLMIRPRTHLFGSPRILGCRRSCVGTRAARTVRRDFFVHVDCSLPRGYLIREISMGNPSPTRLHRFRRRAAMLPSRVLASLRWRHSNRTRGLPAEALLLWNQCSLIYGRLGVSHGMRRKLNDAVSQFLNKRRQLFRWQRSIDIAVAFRQLRREIAATERSLQPGGISKARPRPMCKARQIAPNFC
jgi:hypothetical protein